MKLNGIKKPRVAVQALNPHAEFGNEEKNEIIPAIEEAKKQDINADGPLPCDTSFITAFKNKNHDCIVGMYHDALQSGLKAFGFDRGVTVQGGLPIPITTPAHGTAFDIAGTNKANLEPTLQSFKIALTVFETLISCNTVSLISSCKELIRSISDLTTILGLPSTSMVTILNNWFSPSIFDGISLFTSIK